MEGSEVKLHKQIQDTYYKAFFDVLKERVAEEPPDYDWLIRLYTEIRDKLCKIVKKDSSMWRDMNEKLDPEFFEQLIRNKVFDGNSMHGLILFTFEKCLELGSPARDEATKKDRDEVISMVLSPDAAFANIVPIYIKNINRCINLIYEDMVKFSDDEIKALASMKAKK
jgi:hypothetical protein